MTKKESPTGQGEAKDKTNLTKKITAIPANCQSAAAQRQRILDWLQRSSLTTLEAREKLDIMHPGGRCMELRRMGYNIQTVWTLEHSDAGGLHRVGRYILQQVEDGDR